MKAFFRDHFGLQLVEVKKLVGYDNENFLIKTSTTPYILKTYADEGLLPLLEAETQVLLHLNKQSSGKYPTPLPFKDGNYVKKVTFEGVEKMVRLLTYVEGTFMGELPVTEQGAASLGSFLATLNQQLLGWRHPVYEARDWEWNLESYTICKDRIAHIPQAKDQNLVRYFIQQYESCVLPKFRQLRKSTLHNDANEWNILMAGEQVCGLIDFGDMTYSHLINEVAIGAVYIAYRSEAPLEAILPFVASYHKLLPLTETELSVLYFTMALRLCLSVCNSAFAKKEQPDNAYVNVSEKKAWNLLYRWLEVSPQAAENKFRESCGFAPLPVRSIESKKTARNQILGKNLSLSYSSPIAFERSAFQYMYDSYGNTFLDAYNNIPHVGHAHPKVVAAAREQMGLLNTNTRYLYDSLEIYAAALLSKFPPSLNRIYFVNSGSEATDLALRMARWHTQSKRIVVMEHGYHGHTQMGIEVSDYKFNHPKGIGKQDHISKLTAVGESPEGIAAAAEQSIAALPEKPAAFIAETILGCAGQLPLPKGFLTRVYAQIRQRGGLCIADEVQTGFGRTGRHFWAFESQQVTPDFVILGKPMANGHPMGAVVTTAAIAESFGKGVEFFSSFGGNPVSCVIAKAVLDVIEEEALQEHAQTVGKHYKNLLASLQKYPNVGAVRGTGLFLGLVIEDEKGNPNTLLAQHLKNELRQKNILISTDGPYDNVLKTKPPLCFSRANAERVVHELERILQKQ